MNSKSIIKVDPEIMHGAPVFEGTRVTIATYYDNIRDGLSIKEFLEAFPGVTKDHIERLLEGQRQELAAV
ncbi:MAG: DUF433 domain-containing protein [Anaerolineae bacterium]|nr:DUF433 domain-containing protein [Anaerolineae bacterium]